MRKLLKGLLDDPTADWKRAVTDPMLGELRLSEDADWWEAKMNVGDRILLSCIGGEVEPDANLLALARDIVRELPQFECRLMEHLLSESAKLKEWTDEIKQLRLAAIHLFWPQRPNDGEIAFRGPDQYRIWHCGYVNRQFVGLGFDD